MQARNSLPLAGVVVLFFSSVLSGQDPFGADPFGGGGAPAAGGGNPAPAPNRLQGRQMRDEIVNREQDPVVIAVRDSNPSTPTELMKAVKTMFDYGRIDEMQRYLGQLLAAQMNPDTLVQFERDFGSALFVRLSRDQRVGDAGMKLASDILMAASTASRDDDLLRQAAQQLMSDDPRTRSNALREVQRGGDKGTSAMIQALANAARPEHRRRLGDALFATGATMADPLIGALEAPDAELRAEAMNVLGRLNSLQAVNHLAYAAVAPDEDPKVRDAARNALLRIVGRVPTQREAEIFLYRRAKSYFDGQVVARVDYADRNKSWEWDPVLTTVQPQLRPAVDLSRIVASRLAKQLYDLSPDNIEHRRLFLFSVLEAAKLLNGLDKPLPQDPGSAYDLAKKTGVGSLEDVLVQMMKDDHFSAAVGAAEILGDIGSADVVHATGGSPTPLVQALQHKDRRLRYAAVNAILKLDPRGPFPGSSRVTKTLAWFVSTTGTRRVLVGHPSLERARSIVGAYGTMGFEADTALTGQELFKLATQDPDYEMVLVSDVIGRPSVKEAVHSLRRDFRTAKIPLAITCRADSLPTYQRLAAEYPYTIAVPQPYTTETCQLIARRLLQLDPRHYVTREERLAQAMQSMKWLKKFVDESERYAQHDVHQQLPAIERALSVPELFSNAASILGRLATPRSQSTLVETASQNARPIEERRVAASAFASAVDRRGVHLTSDAILLQYERYNLSGTLDRDTQLILASILDSIEGVEPQP